MSILEYQLEIQRSNIEIDHIACKEIEKNIARKRSLRETLVIEDIIKAKQQKLVTSKFSLSHKCIYLHGLQNLKKKSFHIFFRLDN